jgi:hypothetical protein
MSKKKPSKPVKAKKTASSEQTDKKRIRRVIFKADEWYAGAASSIGISGRSKGARPLALFMPRIEEKAD